MAVRKVLADNDHKQCAWPRTVLGFSTKGVARRALDTKSTWQYPHANAPGCITEGVGLQTWGLSPVPNKQRLRLRAHMHFRCATKGNIDRKLRGAKPKPNLVLRDTLCSCEAYGMKPMYKEKNKRVPHFGHSR